MKKILKKIGDVLFVILLVIMLIEYTYIAYGILDYFNIGADGS